MALSAEQLNRLVELLEQVPQDELERRRSPRVGVQAPVAIVPIEHGVEAEATTAVVHDLSSTGLCLRRRTPMRAGQQFLLQVRDAEGECFRVLCTVRHCRMAGEELYLIGSEFGVPAVDAMCGVLARHVRKA